jgi:hypothetical protein
MTVEFCNCIDVRGFREAFADIFSRELVDNKVRGEFYELWSARSMSEFRDELSDISYGFGRLIAGIFGKPYIHIPGDKLHIAKMSARMNEYGCVRSTRFLINGHCPNKD